MKTKGRIINITVIAFLSLVAIGILTAMVIYASSFSHEWVAKGFSNDTEFTQITVFLPESADFTVDKVMYLRYNLEKNLTEESITPINENARLFADAFVSFEEKTLYSDGKKSSNVLLSRIGGDYALFHKEFANSPDITKDINHDRLLLSRTGAWQLFGGEDLYDFKVTEGENELLVSGVYEDFEGKEYKEFYADKASAVGDIFAVPEKAITCYEIILVNPVKNFALELLKKNLEMPEESYLLVENSKRFGIANLFKKIPTLMKTDEQLPVGVNITPEEMMARRAEKELAVMLAVFVLFAFYPFIWLLVLLYRFIKLVKKLFNKFVIGKIKNKLSYS